MRLLSPRTSGGIPGSIAIEKSTPLAAAGGWCCCTVDMSTAETENGLNMRLNWSLSTLAMKRTSSVMRRTMLVDSPIRETYMRVQQAIKPPRSFYASRPLTMSRMSACS